MMYKKIAKAIKKADIDTQPCDYLNFFCLGIVGGEGGTFCLGIVEQMDPPFHQPVV